MEILAIVVLGASLFFSFSTSERQPEFKTNSRPDNDDPDWTFTQPYELDGSKSEGWLKRVAASSWVPEGYL